MRTGLCRLITDHWQWYDQLRAENVLMCLQGCQSRIQVIGGPASSSGSSRACALWPRRSECPWDFSVWINLQVHVRSHCLHPLEQRSRVQRQWPTWVVLPERWWCSVRWAKAVMQEVPLPEQRRTVGGGGGPVTNARCPISLFFFFVTVNLAGTLYFIIFHFQCKTGLKKRKKTKFVTTELFFLATFIPCYVYVKIWFFFNFV